MDAPQLERGSDVSGVGERGTIGSLPIYPSKTIDVIALFEIQRASLISPSGRNDRLTQVRFKHETLRA